MVAFEKGEMYYKILWLLSLQAKRAKIHFSCHRLKFWQDPIILPSVNKTFARFQPFDLPPTLSTRGKMIRTCLPANQR
ncbi:MAG: hypothetical protein J6U31_03605, partial [Bacteroidales bacterium]|nr:hypothetical protein [Bacteroidales bacterium]